MILIDRIKLETFGNRRLKYYSDLGYDVSGEYFEIDIKDLNIGSRQLVDVICDFCGKKVSIIYKEYIRNISIGNKYACCKFCGSEKAKETNIKNIGVCSHMILIETQEKTKKTNLDRYGVEFLQQSDLFREKSKKTLLDKYEVNHISKTEHFRKMFRETCLENLGVEYPMQSDSVKEKSKKTLLENYGVDNPSKSSSILNKSKNTNFVRWGNENYLITEDYKIKNLIKLSEKWNSDNIMKSELFRVGRFSISKDENYIKYLKNGCSLLKCENGHDFAIDINNYIKRSESNLPLCTRCYPIGDNISIKEGQIYEFIKNIYEGEILESYRDGLEIDIYLPDLKLGFEFNGLYWHSEKFKSKNYHIDKTNYFKERGIRIIHIWEDDWMFRRNIIESQIKNLLKINTEKIFARKCVIKEVDAKISRNFLDNSHIQGFVPSVKKIGLFYKDELMSLMTFDHFEGRKRMNNDEWNLSRFCNKLNTNVIGGASRLLKYFIRNYSPNRIISYADKDWSVGDLYYTIGFSNIGENGSDYKYIVDGKRIHKSRYKKPKLNTELSESNYMKYHGINKIYDCGKIKFEISKI